MANFAEAYKILMDVEFNSRADKFLHKNRGEQFWTLGGVYEKYYPTLVDWDYIQRVVDMCIGDTVKASKLLFFDKILQKQVATIFKEKYWNKNRLGEVRSQVVANEIFLFAVHTGSENAVKKAQTVVNNHCGRCLVVDGKIGIKTIIGLNDIDEIKFSNEYDVEEKRYYEVLVSNRPEFAKFMKGWSNRSEIV
jgi:lysozyme family protein